MVESRVFFFFFLLESPEDRNTLSLSLLQPHGEGFLFLLGSPEDFRACAVKICWNIGRFSEILKGFTNSKRLQIITVRLDKPLKEQRAIIPLFPLPSAGLKTRSLLGIKGHSFPFSACPRSLQSLIPFQAGHPLRYLIRCSLSSFRFFLLRQRPASGLPGL